MLLFLPVVLSDVSAQDRTRYNKANVAVAQNRENFDGEASIDDERLAAWKRRALLPDKELDGQYREITEQSKLKDLLLHEGGYLRWTGRRKILFRGKLAIERDVVLDLNGATIDFDNEANRAPWDDCGVFIQQGAQAVILDGTVARSKHGFAFIAGGSGALIDITVRDTVVDGISIYNTAGSVGLYRLSLINIGWNHQVNKVEGGPGKNSMAHGVYKRGSDRLEIIDMSAYQIQGWAVRLKHRELSPESDAEWSSDHIVTDVCVHHAYGLFDCDEYVENAKMSHAVVRDVSLLLHERAGRRNTVTDITWFGTRARERFISHYVTGNRQTVNGPRMSVTNVTYVVAEPDVTFEYGVGQSGPGIATPRATTDLSQLEVSGFSKKRLLQEIDDSASTRTLENVARQK